MNPRSARIRRQAETLLNQVYNLMQNPKMLQILNYLHNNNTPMYPGFYNSLPESFIIKYRKLVEIISRLMTDPIIFGMMRRLDPDMHNAYRTCLQTNNMNPGAFILYFFREIR